MTRPAVDSGRRVLRRAAALLGESDGRGSVGAAAVVARAMGKFQSDRCFLRASALTYTTLLSLVPLLAVAFSLLKGFGVQRRLEPLILEHLAAGNQEVVSRVMEYIDRTQVASLGAVGLAGLLFTAVSVLGNIELSFNDIWGVRKGRGLLRKTTDYLALLVVTPVLLLASLSLTTTLNAPAVIDRVALLGPAFRLLLRGLPLMAPWAAFTAAYLILPNRRVATGSALLGGIAAGTLWHLAEWAYVRFQIGVPSYNAIYGTLAQLPLLLVWLYLSWCIVLLGAELACVHEMPGRGRGLHRSGTGWVPRLGPVLPALLLVASRFEAGRPGPTEDDLLAQLGLSPDDGLRVLDRLAEAGLLTANREDPPRFLPSVSPDATTASGLLEALLQLGPEPADDRVRKALVAEFQGLTWADLARDAPA